jgi:hypothetical protein
VFESLLAEFVSGEMIRFAVSDGGGSVGMLRQVVKFRGSIVRTLGHRVLLSYSMQTKQSWPWEAPKSNATKSLGSIPCAFPRSEWSPKNRSRPKSRRLARPRATGR